MRAGRGQGCRLMRRASTSGSSSCAANMTDTIRLRRASLYTSHIGMIEPVSTTGLPRPCSMKESALAVYAIVSVPCRMTKPS